jgi:L-alanine-DL-glutamate epimerase-like enolase superfamily enzyme
MRPARVGRINQILLLPPPVSAFVCVVQLKFWRKDLQLAHTWTIARGSTDVYPVALVQLTDDNGITGLGEASPTPRYNESVDTVEAFIRKVDARQLSFDEVLGSIDYLDTVAPGNMAAKCALNLALLDGAAKRAEKPIYDFLGLGFRENRHVTSFSIGIDKPEVIRKKVIAAEKYPVLKLKVGSPDDKANLAALRAAAPTKPVRVDANEAWTTKELALEQIEWLAHDHHIQFVEQPMPATTNPQDLIWLKKRSPLPLFADESYHLANDIAHCAECYHGVNVKLVKTGGVSAGSDALRAARKVGLKTMIGCMIETSVLISAAAHLAELCDYLDVDGNLLTTNDPYLGVTADRGVLSFANAPEKFGLRVRARPG